MHVHRALLFVAATACSGRPSSGPPELPKNTAPAIADAEVGLAPNDALVRAVLERFIDDPSVMPDRQLLPATGPIVVVGTDAAASFTPRALDGLTLDGRPFVPGDKASQQERADAQGSNVAFIAISAIRLDGSLLFREELGPMAPGAGSATPDDAMIVYGVDFVMPSSSQAIKTCCCDAFDRFEYVNGGWRFAARASVRCG